MPRILIVEDNAEFAYGLRNNLEIEGYEVEVAGEGRAALRILEEQTFDLVILDLMLPDVSGIEVLVGIRTAGIGVPVLVLTALQEQEFWLRALAIGADMCITKPWPSLLGFLAHIQALLRRRAALAMTPDDVAEAVRQHGTYVPSDPTGGRGWYLNSRFISAGPAARSGENSVVELTSKERELLLYLMMRPNEIVPEEVLLREIWGYEPHMNLKKTGVLKDTIYRLRRKLEKDPKHPRHIKTASRGRGYYYEP